MDTIRIKFNNAADFYIFEPLFKRFNVTVYNDTKDIKEKDEPLKGYGDVLSAYGHYE